MHPVTSAKSVSKNCAIAPSSLKLSKLGDPRRGRNSVAVKLPSVFGNAISMWPPRGQMCRASRPGSGAPCAPAGIDSSL